MIYIFPGQGSQKIGMGKDIYDAFQSARDVFHEVDDAISYKLSDLIFNGSEDELKSTENTQPALMTVSMAFVRALKIEAGIDITENAKFFAGHSLGEYTALCAASVISLADTAKILRLRGRAMSNAFPSGGAMAAILGLDIETVEKLVREVNSDDNFVQIANDNSDGQIIISGYKKAVDRAMEKSLNYGAKKTVLLEVSGPFHSELMKNAIDPIRECLEAIEFKNPSKPIISNVTAKAETNNFNELLIKQLTERVRWRESILFAKENDVSKCIEIGAGKVLTGLVKRIDPNMELENINSLEFFRDYIPLN